MNKLLSQKIALNIKKIRLENNLSQEKLAYKINIDRKYASIIEKGETKVSVEILNKVCIGLGLTLSDFFHQIDL